MTANPDVFQPVVHSLLETDLYKFTMQQPMLHSMPTNQAEYRFVCRNTPAFPLAQLADAVNAQLDALCALRFSQQELTYLGGLRYLSSDYIDFLRLFQFQRRFITVRKHGDTLEVVARGPQVHVMGFEIYVLAIINELYFRRLTQDQGPQAALAQARARLHAKIALLRDYDATGPQRRHPFEFFDFGLRRRFSGAWQEEVATTLAREVPQFFKGTSNVYLAQKLGLTPIGTMAHDTSKPSRPLGSSSRASKRRRWSRGCKSTVGTWAWRLRMWSEWTPSWLTLISTLPSSSMACATTVVTPWRGARRRWPTMQN